MRAFSHAVVALLGAALPLALYFVLLEPSRSGDVSAAEARLSARQQQLSALALAASHLPELQREQHGLEERLALLEQIRPASRDTGPLRESLRELAAAEGLTRISVEEVTPAADAARVPLRLSAEGPPPAIASLLGRLTRTARLLSLERVELERLEQGRFALQLRLLAFRDKPEP
jgi:Tfp pilus assembly protein PilO